MRSLWIPLMLLCLVACGSPVGEARELEIDPLSGELLASAPDRD